MHSFSYAFSKGSFLVLDYLTVVNMETYDYTIY